MAEAAGLVLAFFFGRTDEMEDGVRRFVRFDDLVTLDELPPEGTEARDRFVEVLLSGGGRCRRDRLESVAPDVAAALSDVNSSIVALAEIIQAQGGAHDED